MESSSTASNVVHGQVVIQSSNSIERSTHRTTKSKYIVFAEAIAALKAGRSIGHRRWAKTTRMFVFADELMQQVGQGQPVPYSLDWYEIDSKGWYVL